MRNLIICGGNNLNGIINLSGAKNAALPIIIGSILSTEEVQLFNVPSKMEDVKVLISILKQMGIKIKSKKKGDLIINGNSLQTWEAPFKLSSKIRYTLLLLGALLAKCGKVKIPYPGGCAIGERKFDLHLYGLKALGADIKINENFIEACANKLEGTEIEFYLPTTTGTENIILAACFAKGKTIIKNANTRPEILDFINFLNSMGAKIKVSPRLVEIEGVKEFHGTKYSIMKGIDEAVTYMIATGIAKGEIMIKDFDLKFIKSDVEYLRKAGLEIFEWGGSVYISAKNEIKPFDMFTAPYPGVNSDMQPLFAALALKAKGISTITDTRFTDRFQYVSEFKKFGADIEAYGNCAVVKGGKSLKGARVKALDLRTGAALILVGLGAEGKTIIENVYQIDRGYEEIEKKLGNLGANIKREI